MLFSPGQFKKNHEKFKKKKKKNNFLLKFWPGSDLGEFFTRFSLFSKVILLIFSSITMLYTTVAEIWSII